MPTRKFGRNGAGAGAELRYDWTSRRATTAASPGIISTTMLTAYCPLHDACLDATAPRVKNAYRAIRESGLIPQRDASDLARDRTMMDRDFSGADLAAARLWGRNAA